MKTKHFIIPGLAKAGTTFVFDQIEAHNADLFNMPKRKELNFFISRNDMDGYRHCFLSHEAGKPYIDASPQYLNTSMRCVDNIIKGLNTKDREVKLLFCLRSACDQVFSHYLHDLKSTITRFKHSNFDLDFQLHSLSCMQKYLRPRYDLVKKLVKSFGKENVLAFDFYNDFNDDFFTNRLSDFLSMDIKSKNTSQKSNPGGWLPRVIYADHKDLEFEQDGIIYKIPKKTLFIVNEARSYILKNINPEIGWRVSALSQNWTHGADLAEYIRPFEKDVNKTYKLLGVTPPALDEDEYNFKPRFARASGEVLSTLEKVDTVKKRVSSVWKYNKNWTKNMLHNAPIVQGMKEQTLKLIEDDIERSDIKAAKEKIIQLKEYKYLDNRVFLLEAFCHVHLNKIKEADAMIEEAKGYFPRIDKRLMNKIRKFKKEKK